ncbi:MAG TPA: hypothetical protein EYP63_04110 [Desulfotomaculum sp.]|nr:hypothetical protein [Desulfotomaculum sp.]
MRRSLDEKGLTLLEVLVAATLMSLIIVGSLLLFDQGVRAWCWTEQEAEVVDNLCIALDRMVYDVRVAREVYFPDEGETIEVSNGTGTNPVLGIGVPSVGMVYYEVEYDGGMAELEREVNGGANRPVTTRMVTQVWVSRPSEALVKIELRGKGGVSVRTAAYARAFSP